MYKSHQKDNPLPHPSKNTPPIRNLFKKVIFFVFQLSTIVFVKALQIPVSQVQYYALLNIYWTSVVRCFREIGKVDLLANSE